MTDAGSPDAIGYPYEKYEFPKKQNDEKINVKSFEGENVFKKKSVKNIERKRQ